MCPSGSILSGVDVSQLNGAVDWTNVAGDGVLFALARVSSGTNADLLFGGNHAGIKAAGMIRGAYQFFQTFSGSSGAGEPLFVEDRNARIRGSGAHIGR